MGMRAYLLVSVVDDMRQEDFIQELVEIQDMPDVVSVDAVIGNADMAILIDTPMTVETAASKILDKSWVKDMHILKINICNVISYCG